MSPITPADLIGPAKSKLLVELGKLQVEFIAYRYNDAWESSPEEWVDGEYVRIVYFKDQLERKLNYEIELSEKLIIEKIESKNLSEKKIELFLKHVLSDVGYLISIVKSEKLFFRYLINLKILYLFVDLLFQRFSAFISSSEHPISKEAMAFLFSYKEEEMLSKQKKTILVQSNETKNKAVDIISFKWKTTLECNNTELLHKVLSEKGIIPKDELTKKRFLLAFGGEILNEPLVIKWLLEKNKSIKPTLIRIIKHILMDELQVIENMGTGELANAIAMIFVNKHGKPAENLKEAISQVSKKSTDINEIKLINELRNISFS